MCWAIARDAFNKNECVHEPLITGQLCHDELAKKMHNVFVCRMIWNLIIEHLVTPAVTPLNLYVLLIACARSVNGILVFVIDFSGIAVAAESETQLPLMGSQRKQYSFRPQIVLDDDLKLQLKKDDHASRYWLAVNRTSYRRIWKHCSSTIYFRASYWAFAAAVQTELHQLIWQRNNTVGSNSCGPQTIAIFRSIRVKTYIRRLLIFKFQKCLSMQ